MMGNKATTGIGKASVTHQVIINPAIARALHALGLTAKGFTKNKKRETAIPDKIASSFSCGGVNFKQTKLRDKFQGTRYKVEKLLKGILAVS